MEIDLKKLFFDRKAQIATILFAVVTVWWLTVQPFAADQSIVEKHTWSSTYELLSLLGGIFGLFISRYWGGWKSFLGRSIIAFSIGLFLQSFGQTVYNYYTLFAHIEAPYPSWGDLGYFGSIPAYIYGVFLLGKVSGLKFSLKSLHNRMLAFLLPLLMLVASYFIFLKDYEFDWSQPLTIFLDFGYPLGQALYVAIALLVFFASRQFLGGMMKKPVLLLLFALVWQYFCDFNFLYQANHGTWYAGGVGDYMYAASYYIMTLALIYLGMRFHQINES